MKIPDPEPGMVVRYDYLWYGDKIAGRNQGKDRPACIVAASDIAAAPRFVVLLPITHTPPAEDVTGIEIPETVKRAVGLDDVPCWVVISEHNVDEWPNGGLSPATESTFHYGFIPPKLFARIRDEFLALVNRSKSVQRL